MPFPMARRVVIDAGRIETQRHLTHTLGEIDVTLPREFIRSHKTSSGETLSFTSFIVKCLAQAIHEYPAVQALRNWRNQLIVFDDVDVVTMIEAQRDHVAIPHIIRKANHRTVQQIHNEIRTIQNQPHHSDQNKGLTKWGVYFPQFIRDVFWDVLRRNPHWLRQMAGTVVITAVGMFWKGAGWGFGFLPLHSLGLTIGGIVERPALVEGQLVLHEYLCISISFDHDVVDGAPIARFAQRFRDLVESGYGLDKCEPANDLPNSDAF
jgi:pyruvate/2-oxoglutarate dehydrogenase complex dihydrolipoamide acyltransferase (E2) component